MSSCRCSGVRHVKSSMLSIPRTAASLRATFMALSDDRAAATAFDAERIDACSLRADGLARRVETAEKTRRCGRQCARTPRLRRPSGDTSALRCSWRARPPRGTYKPSASTRSSAAKSHGHCVPSCR